MTAWALYVRIEPEVKEQAEKVFKDDNQKAIKMTALLII